MRMLYSLLFVVIAVTFVSGGTAFANDSELHLTPDEVKKLLKSAEKPILIDCLQSFEVDVFVQTLLGNGVETRVEGEIVPESTLLQQLREYLDKGHIKVRTDLKAKKIPKSLTEKCETMAQLAVEVMAIQTRAAANGMDAILLQLLEQLRESEQLQPKPKPREDLRNDVIL